MSKGPRQSARTSASQLGGKTTRRGDKELAERLARALNPRRRDDGRALTHGFHAWPARMHPHTAKVLVDEAGAREGLVADPFMGGGTVLVEALVAGRAGYGSDVNPVARLVAWARTRRWDRRQTRALVDGARKAVEDARAAVPADKKVPKAFFDAEGEWYDPPALVEVWSLAEVLRERTDEVGRMLQACLSSILVKASRQASDSITRVDRDHRWVPKRRVEQWFVARAEEHAEGLAALAKVAPDGAAEPQLALRDAREALPVGEGSVATIVTSPPYPGTFDYVEHHRRRYAALGLKAQLAEEVEMGSRREQRKRGWQSATDRFENDLAVALGAWRPSLVAGGRVFLVIGDGQRREGDGVVRALPVVERAAAAAELRVVASASQARRVHVHVSGQKRARKEEHIVALEKAE